jgi:hypothetical protein
MYSFIKNFAINNWVQMPPPHPFFFPIPFLRIYYIKHIYLIKESFRFSKYYIQSKDIFYLGKNNFD